MVVSLLTLRTNQKLHSASATISLSQCTNIATYTVCGKLNYNFSLYL